MQQKLKTSSTLSFTSVLYSHLWTAGIMGICMMKMSKYELNCILAAYYFVMLVMPGMVAGSIQMYMWYVPYLKAIPLILSLTPTALYPESYRDDTWLIQCGNKCYVKWIAKHCNDASQHGTEMTSYSSERLIQSHTQHYVRWKKLCSKLLLCIHSDIFVTSMEQDCKISKNEKRLFLQCVKLHVSSNSLCNQSTHGYVLCKQ